MESSLELTLKEDSLTGDSLREGDLQVCLSAGVIVNTCLGSLIALRDKLEGLFGERLIYFTLSNDRLYVVKSHELSDAKRDRIGGRR